MRAHTPPHTQMQQVRLIVSHPQWRVVCEWMGDYERGWGGGRWGGLFKRGFAGCKGQSTGEGHFSMGCDILPCSTQQNPPEPTSTTQPIPSRQPPCLTPTHLYRNCTHFHHTARFFSQLKSNNSLISNFLVLTKYTLPFPSFLSICAFSFLLKGKANIFLPILYFDRADDGV